MFSIVLLTPFILFAAILLARTAVPAGPGGLRRVGAKDRTSLLAAILATLALGLLVRSLLTADPAPFVAWLVGGLLFAAAVAFAGLRWSDLPTRRRRRNARTGEERPRSWVVAGSGLGFAVLFLIVTTLWLSTGARA